MKILSVVGTRPNFMKIAPIHRAFLEKQGLIEHIIVHTGQHYDKAMSEVFFTQLGIPKPDINLNISSGSHTSVTSRIMSAFEEVCNDYSPDYVLVVGDVNSTLACGLVASQKNIPLIHVEAGLRSADRKMPEEKNRIVVDHLSDLLFVTEPSALYNLANEGISEDKIHYVGNVMIDSIIHNIDNINNSDILEKLNLKKDKYILFTMHRPSNVDTSKNLIKIVNLLTEISTFHTVVFPIHPRTKNNLEKHGLIDKVKNNQNIILVGPQGYHEFIHLIKNARLMVTDSGGIQEEASHLLTPCITFRNSTERPSTITYGTNTLIKDLNVENAIKACKAIIDSEIGTKSPIPFWDGKAAERITNIILKRVNKPLLN